MRIFLKIFIFFCKNELTSQKKDDRIEPSSRIDDRKYGNYYCKASSLKGGIKELFYGKWSYPVPIFIIEILQITQSLDFNTS